VPLPADHTLVIGVSGVIAEKTGAAQEAYNNASLSARAVLTRWHGASGRSDATLAAAVASAGAEAIRKTLNEDRLRNRFDQFIAESTEIIPAVGDALVAGDIAKLGPLVDRSQQLAEHLLKNQVPETIFLAASARECGAAAASSFGAGFGGSVWALVRSTDVPQFIADWKTRYQSQFPESAGRAAFVPAAAGVAAVRINDE
jgi:galactokinase